MIRTFNILPLINAEDTRFVVKEDFMSMFLKLNIDFGVLIPSYDIANSISNTIQEIMSNLPQVDVQYAKTEIFEKW